MNRKFVNGLLLLTVATGGVGTFTSCKDTEQEFRNVVMTGQQDLSDQIAAIRNLADPTFLSNLRNEIDSRIAAGDFATASELAAAVARIDALQENLEKLDEAYKAADEKLREDLTGIIETHINDLKEELKNLGVKVDEIKETADNALAKALENAGTIVKLQEELDALEGKYGELKDELGKLDKKVDDMAEKYDGLIETLQSDIESLGQRADLLQTDIENLNRDVQSLYNTVMQMLAKLVTSIIVEQAHNPIFGTLNFPIGLENNLVANYYYLSENNVKFPGDMDDSFEYTTSNVWDGVKLSDIGFAGYYEPTPGAPVLPKLGDLYLTVNPAERDFSDLRLSIVDSQDEEVLNGLELAKTDKVLAFGAGTRAADNGFYYAPVLTPDAKAAIDQVGLDIEPGLLNAFKDAIKNHTKSDFLQLAQVLYRQFNTKLPAYTVKVEWDEYQYDHLGNQIVDTKTTKSVRSGYDLALTTFRPLSYRSGWGFGADKGLPTFGSISSVIDRMFDDLDLNFEIKFNTIQPIQFQLNIKDFEVKVDDIVITIAPIKVTIPGTDETGVTEETTITLKYDPNKGELDKTTNDNALNPLVDAIVSAVNDYIKGDDGLIGVIKEQIENQVNEKIIKDLNEQLAGINGQIQDNVDKIVNQIKDELAGKLGRLDNLVDLYNRLANKINKVLENPNAYLQVMMAYKGQDGNLHHLSNVANDATPVTVGDGVMELFATSYNAEIIVPSFKKYVAVVGAYEGGVGENKTAIATLANDAEYLNEVRDGNQQRFFLDLSKLKSGYTYKIIYSSLDFRGYTSTQAYYVRAI